VAVSHRARGLRNSDLWKGLEFGFLYITALVMKDGTQARSTHTEDLLPQETDEHHLDQVRAEAPGNLPGGSRGGDDPVVFPFPPN
jgi:hypothetical protein